MTPAELSAQLLTVVDGALERRGESTLTIGIDDVLLERPKNREHGDWASNIAMKLAKPLKTNPRELALELADGIRSIDGVSSVDVAGPGFINMTLDAAAAGAIAKTIVEQGDEFGRGNLYIGVKIDLEFVSANPTGPIHLGGVRWAAVGDSLARIFTAVGGIVTKEYYFNDHGGQIDRFARSLLASYLGEPTPEDGYGGQYIADIADRIVTGFTGDLASITREDQQEIFRAMGTDLMFGDIKASLHDFGVDFDVYFHENNLHEGGDVGRAIERLRTAGHIYEAEGATWFRSTDFGDDKDRVMRKSDGGYTYFLPDVAYHVTKWQRGFGRAINEQGADHHSTITRVRAGLQALSLQIPKGWPDYVLHQMVTVMRSGEEVKLSKRAGSYVTLRDLIDEVGCDATRYFLVARKVDSQLIFDIDLARSQSNDNPVYYIQYAHARVCSLQRQLGERGLGWNRDNGLAQLALLTSNFEQLLMVELSRYPEMLDAAAQNLEPHMLAQYLRDLATAFHAYYNGEAILVADDNLRDARLNLCAATQQVLHNGLDLLGVCAPEKM